MGYYRLKIRCCIWNSKMPYFDLNNHFRSLSFFFLGFSRQVKQQSFNTNDSSTISASISKRPTQLNYFYLLELMHYIFRQKARWRMFPDYFMSFDDYYLHLIFLSRICYHFSVNSFSEKKEKKAYCAIHSWVQFIHESSHKLILDFEIILFSFILF